MIRKHFYIREDQEIELKNMPGSEASILRAALDEYILRHTKLTNTSTSTSPSTSISSSKSIPSHEQ